MKRQSTTKKVSKSDAKTIRQACKLGEGIIVRFKGKEYGVVSVDGTTAETWEGVGLDLRQCTVRKATLPTFEASQQSIDELFRSISAFTSFADFQESAKLRGYVPTLSPLRNPVNASDYALNARIVELATRIESRGYRTFPGLSAIAN